MKTKTHTMRALTAAMLFALAAGAPQAMDLTVGGMIDTGLRLHHVNDGSTGSKTSYEMADSLLDGNRVLFLGTEQLNSETEVGFWLEAGFDSDTGASTTAGSIFDRGAYMWVKNNHWGQLSAGRSGAVRAGATPLTFDITWNRINPFGTGWGELGNPVFLMPFYGFSLNNMLQYSSPKIGPFQVNLQHSFAIANGTDVVEGTSSADRYSSISVTYDSEVVNLVAMLDTMNESSTSADQKDMVSALVGGNVKVGAAKLYAWGSWFKDADNIIALPGFTDYTLYQGLDRINGWAASVGTRLPLAGGEINVYGLVLKAKYDDVVSTDTAAQIGKDLSRYGAGVGYTYPLSKRTTLYSAVGFYKDVASLTNSDGHTFDNPMSSQLFFGINHKF